MVDLAGPGSSDDPTSRRFRGQGWYCYSAEDAGEQVSLCHRSETQCASSRQRAAGQGFTVTSCQFRQQAACLIVTTRSSLRGDGDPVCTSTRDECERHRMRYLADPENYLFVSECETID
ncbi:hypothetical protein [Haliangium sp.]|uniref:hypothetical protein n=1 Tax=Haliangium sp. TaxID=2663208 RepID=UPI003D0D55A1